MKSLNMFFTDNEIIIVEKKSGFSELSEYVSARIPSGYIVNGLIEKYDDLVIFVENVLSRTKITAKNANLLLHDKIVSYKVVKIPDDLKQSKIRKHIETTIVKDLALPFVDPIIDYHIHYMKGYPEAIVFGVSQSVMSNYNDLLKDVGLKLVSTDVPALASYKLYNISSNNNTTDDYSMFANVYGSIVSINFFNRQYPIFNFIADLDSNFEDVDPETFIQNVQDEIYRMSNYFVWNLMKGEHKVDKAIIVPMTSSEDYNDKLKSTLKSNNLTGVDELFFFENEDEFSYDIDIKYMLTMANSL